MLTGQTAVELSSAFDLFEKVGYSQISNFCESDMLVLCRLESEQVIGELLRTGTKGGDEGESSVEG